MTVVVSDYAKHEQGTIGLNLVYTTVLGNKELFLDVAFSVCFYSVGVCTSAIKWWSVCYAIGFEFSSVLAYTCSRHFIASEIDQAQCRCMQTTIFDTVLH